MNTSHSCFWKNLHAQAIKKSTVIFRRWECSLWRYYTGCQDATHLFGNPAILLFRTRGFASPDYSGFARSENVLKLRSNRWTPRTALLNKKPAFNKKGALSSSEDESAPCVGNIPGARMQSHLFGNPAILLGQDPLALRHQISLVLPVRRTFFSLLKSIGFSFIKCPKK